MTSFTPISATIGGGLIGLAVALLMLLNGRIAGISGIAGNVLQFQRGEWRWQIAFLVGLVAAPLLLHAAGYRMPHPAMPASWAAIVIGGLLVGFGTRLSGGCTSGHGLCGMARLSPRSIVATAIFMVTAIVVVFLVRHVWGGTL
ncbi:MAG TPA: YeeE/YedE family protein [Stellaceae bacterium]|nr:YeeE/YedE family protein [Stellaceae bacterium]